MYVRVFVACVRAGVRDVCARPRECRIGCVRGR